jgi:mRNA-degrading endonuclease toxin of MazEF toxin-antitoxin module
MVDGERLIRRLGRLTADAVTEVLQRLQEMFTSPTAPS